MGVDASESERPAANRRPSQGGFDQAERFTLWRQDDNGNEVAIATGLSRSEAEERARVFEARGHKQLYWVAPDA